MGELKIERHYPVAPERLFAFLTETANLLKWWGPEGTSVAEQSLDLTRTGPWNFVLIDPQGGHHRMSGEVRAVDAPHSVEFTLIVYEPVDNPFDQLNRALRSSPRRRRGITFHPDSDGPDGRDDRHRVNPRLDQHPRSSGTPLLITPRRNPMSQFFVSYDGGRPFKTDEKPRPTRLAGAAG